MFQISSRKDKFLTFLWPLFNFATKLNLIRGKFQFSFVSHFSPETVQCPVSHQIKRWKSKTFLAQNILQKIGHCLYNGESICLFWTVVYIYKKNTDKYLSLYLHFRVVRGVVLCHYGPRLEILWGCVSQTPETLQLKHWEVEHCKLAI